MAFKKKQADARKAAAAAPALPDIARRYRNTLWLVFFAAALFFIPQAMDRYLTSRFFLLSIVLLGGLAALWKYWLGQGNWRLNGFDLLLLIWYGLNVAAVGWAFSWSEGVFYAQKVFLLLGVYWLVREALLYDEGLVRRVLAGITNALTLLVSVLMTIQIGMAFREYGLDNQHLYDYATGVFGNKGLAADFLFFLLIFNILFKEENRNKRQFWVAAGFLSLLLLLLQTRTVYLALLVAAAVYLPARMVLESAFRPVFLKKILPAGTLGIVLLIAVLSWKGKGSTLAERLNPATYLESVSANERRFVWYKTDLLNADHYWWGVGNGSWKIWFPSKRIQGAYRLQEKGIVFTRTHNDYLEIRAEMGIIGALLFISLFVAAFLAAAAALRQGTDGRVRSDIVVLAAGLMGYCVIQYFDFPRERIELQAILALMFALLAHYSRSVWAALPGVQARRGAGFFMKIMAAGLVFNIFIGWSRISGEIHTAATLKAQAAGDYPTMQREAKRARNLFYTYNDVTIPLQWFEGIAFYQMNQVPESVAAFAEAYRLNPWAFQVINNYASALVRAGRYREAIPLFEQAIVINPKYDEGKFNLCFVWKSLGDTVKAREWLGRVDTITNPKTDDERLKNKTVLQKKAAMEKALK